GRNRFYDLHIPQKYDENTSTAVVLVFHGGLGNPAQQRSDSRMDSVADKYGFIVVYPAGTGILEDRLLTFNSGSGFGYAKENNIDDVGFTRALLDDIETFLNVDKNRVYATGFSNGAFMCYRLAFELSDRIAAFAPVSGVLGVEPSAYNLSKPVPIIHFHGKEDEYVPYEGGVGTKSIEPISHPSVSETIQFWVDHNGCPEEPTEETRIGKAVCTVYAPGKEGSEVILWTLEDGGHTWPGGSSTLSESQVGKINTDISASELMWQFFETHAIPSEKMPKVTITKRCRNITRKGTETGYLNLEQALTGDIVEFEILVKNIGEGTATDVNVVDLLPDGLTYVLESITGPNADEVSAPKLKWMVETIPPGGLETLSFKAKVQ
ncbi:MAG: PHB depolymerase family esterase, partial [Candidatus Desantisbacteria bacterium]